MSGLYVTGVICGVIEVGKSLSVGDAIQDHVYQTCIRTRPTSQAKGHSYELELPHGVAKAVLASSLSSSLITWNAPFESIPENMVDLDNPAKLSSMLPIGALEIEEISFKAL
jgi:hypothetical protein